jgi:hypothetical protein
MSNQTNQIMYKLKPKKIAIATMCALAVASGIYLMAADHNDAPAVMGKGSDITDLYAFQSPSNPDNLVFVVNVLGLIAPSATAAAAFDPEVMIEINIDNSATKDNIEDLVIQATFADGKVTTYGPVTPIQTGVTSTLVKSGAAIQANVTAYGSTPVIAENSGIKVFAGPRDDPFFFDLDQFKSILAGTATGFNNPGTDHFAGTNVLSFVIEVPKSKLGSGPINVWANSNRKM